MRRRRTTSQDVARHAGVSRTTVSFVLNGVKGANISEDTRRRVLDAAAELGYVPDASAQALARGRTQTIALILSRADPHPSASSAHFQIIEGLAVAARRHGVSLLVDTVLQSELSDSYLHFVRTRRIDGLLLSDLRLDDRSLGGLVEVGVPIVALDHASEDGVSSVELDNYGCARAAVAHLLALGHARIGLIAHAPAVFRGVSERIRGYRDALAAAGSAADPALEHYGDYSPGSGLAGAEALLGAARPPSALFVTNDEVAFGALTALHRRGLRVPQDVAVVGFDDHPLAMYALPPLTTVRLPFAEMGRQAVELLMERSRGQAGPARRVVLQGELIIRESSGGAGERWAAAEPAAVAE